MKNFNKSTIAILSILAVVSFFIIRSEAQVETLATIPSYNSKCVQVWEEAQGNNTPEQAREAIECIQELLNSLKDVEVPIEHINALEHPETFSFTADEIVKLHIQTASETNIDRETKRGKILVNPTSLSLTLEETKKLIK